MEFASFLPATIFGYIAFHAATHPHSKINRKLPTIKKGRIQISPSIRINITEDMVVHFHHWFNLTLILIVSLFITSAVLDSFLTRGFLVGAILQGLQFPDRHLIHRM